MTLRRVGTGPREPHGVAQILLTIALGFVLLLALAAVLQRAPAAGGSEPAAAIAAPSPELVEDARRPYIPRFPRIMFA